jgi:transposase
MGSYAGVDWASEKHDVLVADAAGEGLLAATFAHDEQGLRSLCRQLVRLGVELVAVERPDGLLVERLLDAGLRVLPLHPNQVAAARDRFRVWGGKSDRFDAFVLCELARTDQHRFRVLEPDSDETKALRALTRAREDVVGTRTALTNQLRAELERFWPGPLGLFTDLNSRISLAFLERYPSPADARGLGEARLRAFLERERYSGRQEPAQLLAKLRRAAHGRVGELELATRRRLVLTMVAMIKAVNQQIKELERQIAAAIRAHPDGAIFTSLFKQRNSVICAAELLAEIGDCRGRYPSRDALAGDAGQSAVAIESGKRTAASFRWGCNKRLARRVLHTRRYHPPLAPLGPTPLRRRPCPWPRSPARATHPRACLVSHRVAVLARRRPIRPRPPPRPAASCHRHHPHHVGPRARPRCHPADGRRRCHPKGGPHGRARGA